MDPTNNIATDLFYKIRSRFSGLKLGAADGTVTINPEEARFFDFDYKDGDLPIGHVSISLSEENSMKVYFSTGITESMNTLQKQGWYGFLKELRNFAKRRLMAFDTRDIAKDNLDKRDYQFLSQSNSMNKSSVGESVMNESQLYGTRTMSFQKLMDTRLIIKHSKTLEDDMQPGARSRNISALFVENQDGERFKYPFIHLAGARAMQRHVANGGLPYDEVGKSIISMSEEIAQLKSFSNYVVRNDLMNSDTNDIVEKSTQALDQLREQIARLSKQSYYEQYKESFQERSPLEVPHSVVEEFKDKFTVKSFREELESVFPILYRLMQENNSVDYEDIVSMTTENINDEADVDLSEDEDEFAKFEQWIMNLGEESPITSEDEEIKSQAVKELQELVSEPFPAGVDGTNAIESLKGIIEDPQLYKGIKETAKQDPEADLRGAIKQYLELYAPDVLEQLDFGDFDANTQAAAQPEAGTEEPQMAGDDPEERQKSNIGVKELAEFIHSFYDKESGTFPKGPEGVVTMVGKKFGEQAEQVARKFVERMAPHQEQGAEELEELSRMRELAGVQAPAQEQISNEAKIDWNSDDVEEVEAMNQKFYVKDTPEGKLLLGDDVGGYFYTDHNGGEREGHITFVYNMDTGKFLEYPEDYSDSYGYLSDREVEEFVKDVVREVEDKIGPDDGPKESQVSEGMRLSDQVGLALKAKGVKYSPDKEDEIIGMAVEVMKEMGIDKKTIRGYISYDEDFVPEMLDMLDREPDDGPKEPKNPQAKDYAEEDSAELRRIREMAGIREDKTGAALNLLAAIRSRLEQFKGDKHLGREMANIAEKLNMSVDQFEEFMDSYEYGSNPEEAAQQLVKHLRGVDPRSISVTDRDFDEDDDGVSESQDGTFHVDTKKEPMIDVKVVDYHYDSYAEDIIIKLKNAETGEPVEINDITSGRAEIENWVQRQMEKQRDDRDYSEDSGEELDRIRKLSGISQGLGL